MKRLISILLFTTPALLSINVTAQTDESWKLYDDSDVAKILVVMNQDDYDWMMNNPHSDSLHLSTVRILNKHFDETIENVGIRIRGNTSRDSQKKSFKLSFNDFVPGRTFYGIDKMNLNGEHNDPSISRAKICWDIFQQIGMKASRASHVELYINTVYHGLYLSIEDVDDKFLKKNFSNYSGNLWKCLYPADLVYKSDDPDSYKFYSGTRRTYELTTNEEEDDYAQLARLIKIINKTVNNVLSDSLESILNVVEFLKYEAINILVGSWDDYWSLMNNYYLYFEPSEKKFHWIPYDYDNTFGISWWDIDWANADPYHFPQIESGSRPLIEKILQIPEYRNLYTHFLKFYRDNVVNQANLYLKINNLKDTLAEYANSDTYRVKDYGFTMNDYYNSFSSINKIHVKKGIVEFINERYNSLPGRLSFVDAKPVVYNIDYEPKNPGPNDSIYFYASGFDESKIESMTIKFHPGLLTVIYDYPMTFKPIDSKKVEDDDRWVGVIPPLSTNGNGRFQIEISDNSENVVLFPRNGFINISASGQIETGQIIINEFLTDNVNTNTDPAGEYEDWIEIYNTTQNDIQLTGLYLTDNKSQQTKFKLELGDQKIKHDEHILIWCDEDHNDNQAGIHVNFKLSKGGEFIGITASDGTTWIDSLSFGPQPTDTSYGRISDGSINWRFTRPTPGSANSTTVIHGDPLPTNFTVYIYPNPFNSSTNIWYTLPEAADVLISIYDMLGREIWSKNDNGMQPGVHTLIWKGTNKFESPVVSGLYLCIVSAGKYISTSKLVLLK